MTDAAELERQLAELPIRYAEQLADRLQWIRSAWAEIRAGTGGELHSRLRSELHLLAGSAGTFGYARISELAAELEQRIQSWSERPDARLEELEEAIGHLVAELSERTGSLDSARPPEALVLGRERAGGAAAYGSIFVVEDDSNLGRALEQQLQSFGYAVSLFPNTEGVAEAVAEAPPAALILDLALPEGPLAGIDLLAELRSRTDLAGIPIVYISARGDLEARLAAVRSGGAAFLAKPLDLLSLTDRLHRLFEEQAQDPFRILIVEDDELLAEHMALVLRGQGMAVTVASEPRSMLEHLEKRCPDLMLMDVHLPLASGPELVQVVRQFDHLQSLPIVYLSVEADLDRQLAALGCGADDFLTKPVSDQHLVDAVTVRAKRARKLAAMMFCDSLTGLLSHVPLKQRVASELSRCARLGTPLIFALIDVDKFKGVNDRFGHPTGDRVLRSLAQLLCRRLRACDSIGRYGGEEFGIVLPECGEASGLRVVDELRIRFSDLRFGSGDTELQVTFSAGLAVADPNAEVTADELIEEADAALYRAKRLGRNCIQVGEASPHGPAGGGS